MMAKRKASKKRKPKKRPSTPSGKEATGASRKLTDAQLEIMQIVWADGEVAVTDVWKQISASREVARNTILTVMDRLFAKGWLTKRRIGNTHLYQAAVDEQDNRTKVVQSLVERLFSGAADQMVMALLDGRGVSDEEAARIRKLIDDRRKKDKRNR